MNDFVFGENEALQKIEDCFLYSDGVFTTVLPNGVFENSIRGTINVSVSTYSKRKTKNFAKVDESNW